MYAVVDIGGSTVRVAFVDNSTWSGDRGVHPKLVSEASFVPAKTYESARAQLIAAIASQGGQLDGIGIGILGRLNASNSRVLEADYGKQWVGQPLEKDLLDRFRCPIIMDNDNVNAARAEAVFGSSHGDFLWIGSGSGHGVARVSHHRGYSQGEEGMILEFENLDGHPLVDALQRDCDSRNVEKRAGRPLSQFSNAEWNSYFETLSRHIAGLWAEGNSRIVFGGGVVMNQRSRFQRFFKMVEHDGLPEGSLAITSLGLDAGLYGAADLIDHHIELGKTLMSGPTLL